MVVDTIELIYPEIMRKQVQKLSTPDKLELIKQVFQKEMPEHEHAIAEYISEVNAARVERNDIIHRLWMPTDSPEAKNLISPRHPANKTPRRVTTKSINALVLRIIDLIFELSDWHRLSNDVRRRQWLALHGKLQPPTAPPNAPRISAKDQRKRPQPEPPLLAHSDADFNFIFWCRPVAAITTHSGDLWQVYNRPSSKKNIS